MKRHFQINTREPLVHCFARCGISGTYENAIAMIEGVNERAARKIILRHSRIATGGTAKRKSRSHSRPVDVVPDLSFASFIPAIGLEYLSDRGINPGSIARWGIGWDEDEKRIVIPAHDESGTLRFLIRRAVMAKQHPKYLYSEGFPRTSLLFGACNLSREYLHSTGLVLVEGSIDTIIQHQNGIIGTAGILGSGLSVRHAEIIARLRPRRVFLLVDPDSAGVRNVFSAEEKLKKYPLFVGRYPRGKNDPAELSRKEAERIIERALPLGQFMKRVPGTVKSRMRRKEAAAYG